MRRDFTVFTVSICFVLCLVLFSSTAGCAEKVISLSNQYNWKMVSFFPSGHTEHKALVDFINKINQRTGGKVKITFYESTLGVPADHWEMLKGNAVQLAFLADAYNGNKLPVTLLGQLPFEIPGPAGQRNVYDAWLKAGYLKEINDNMKLVLYKAQGMVYLWTTKKKVEKLEDFKGMKIRVAGSLMGQIVTALGAAPINLTGGESYLALQTGVADGTITGADQVLDRKFYEPCKFVLRLPVSFWEGTWILGMNKETWNALPKELQTLIDETAKEVIDADVKYLAELDKQIWASLIKAGVTSYTITPQELGRWKKTTAGIATKYIQERAGQGYPLNEALELMRKTTAAGMK